MTAAPASARILVAVDFSEASASAVALAGALAEAFGVPVLSVLHAETLEMPPYFTSSQIEALEAERRDARHAAAEYVQAFAALHTPVPVEAVIADGPAADAVLQRAAHFALVVLGTHGRRGPRRWWLGSVAEAVVQGASTPVLVTRVADEATTRALQERRLRVTVAGREGAAIRGWARLLEAAGGATIRRAPDIAACGPGQLPPADLVLTGLGLSGQSTDATLQVLHACPHPVLFVPDAEVGVPERRPS